MWSSAPPALCVTLLWVGRNPWYWTSLSKESLCLSLFLTFTLKSPLRIVRNWYNMRMHGQPRYQIWIKCDKRQMTSCVHKMCGQTYGQTNMKRAITLAKIKDHGQPRYQIWKKRDKRQMTSCVHKMCRPTYGQTNMKWAITLAKINHPWNRYNMPMLRSWPTKIPNMNKIQQKTND
jgi:hypothetical protein